MRMESSRKKLKQDGRRENDGDEDAFRCGSNKASNKGIWKNRFQSLSWK